MSEGDIHQSNNMLTYYHGSNADSIRTIYANGASIDFGKGELGKGYYIGSSMWRAFSWAWLKVSQGQSSSYGVIEYQFNENDFHQLDILCLNRRSAERTYDVLQKNNRQKTWTSDHDAIWAPIVGKNVKDSYQIKFESKMGENFINQQKKSLLWP